MTHSTTITVPHHPPSPNRMRGAHWSAAKKARDLAGWHTIQSIRLAGDPKANNRPARIRISWVQHRGPSPDYDNAIARCKPIIDQLVASKVLVDDSPAWMRITSITITRGNKPSVAFQIDYQ